MSIAPLPSTTARPNIIGAEGMKPHVRHGLVAPSPSKAPRRGRRPNTAPAGSRSSARPAAVARWSSSESVELVNEDWDRVAAHMDRGRTLDSTLAEHSLEATRDVKRWENALLQEQLAELEACGVHKWLETTKRGLGLFLCIDSGGRLIVSGVEAPSSASREGVPVGCEVLSINGAPVYPDESGTSAVTALLSTVCHRRVRFVLSPPAPSALGTAGHRAWQPFPDFEALTVVGEPLVTIEHCCCCADHQDTTRHDEGKYVGVANELKDAILDLVPYARVELKPFDRHDPIMRGRLGTMEVQLGWRGVDGSLCKRVVYSKRVRGRWPKVWKVAETVLTQLKMTPAVVAFTDPKLAAATAIQASVRGHQAREPPAKADGTAEQAPTASETEAVADAEEATEEDEEEDPEPEPAPAPQPQAPARPAAPSEPEDAEPELEPESEPEPEPEPGPAVTTEADSAPEGAMERPDEPEPHPERARWTAAVGRWVHVDPDCEDEDTVAEIESLSPGGGLCRLCEVLPELEEGLLMLLLERTSISVAADEEGEEDGGDDRTDVYPCDVMELVDDETTAMLDAQFGSAAEWAARCAEARTERLALASALDASQGQRQQQEEEGSGSGRQGGGIAVRIRQLGPGSEGLYCTARSELLHAAAGEEAGAMTLVGVSEELGGYDDRPFEVEHGAPSGGRLRLWLAEGEIEQL
jgi:hypothetical protein